DEPSMGLAPAVADAIFERIAELHREDKITILLVEQRVAEAVQSCDFGYVLETGRVVLSGTGAADAGRPHQNRLSRHVNKTDHQGEGEDMMIVRKSWSRWLAAASLAAVAALLPQHAPAQTKEVKVALVVPLSGPWARQGLLEREGAEMAIDDINAAGGIKALGGAKMKLIIADTG